MAGWRKRELQSERLYRMSGVSFKFLAKCSSAHLWWETPPARESIIKIQQGRQFPKLTYGLEEITFSSARGKRCLNTWGIRHNTQKGLFQFFLQEFAQNWYYPFLKCLEKKTPVKPSMICAWSFLLGKVFVVYQDFNYFNRFSAIQRIYFFLCKL